MPPFYLFLILNGAHEDKIRDMNTKVVYHPGNIFNNNNQRESLSMLRFFLTLCLCSSMAFAAYPPKHTNSSKSGSLSKRLTAAEEKISIVRKSNFSMIFPGDSCAGCCNDGNGGDGTSGDGTGR